MRHRIVVLGAGYAGVLAAGRLARRLSADDIEITVVNASPDFVERMRMHQLASGHPVGFRSLADLFEDTGVRVRVARVTGLDPERRTVAVTDEDGDAELGYDTLLYALGSTVDRRDVPGVAEFGHDVTGLPSAVRLRERLAGLGAGAAVLVVGEGLTGIETAAEIAEARPDLKVALAARGELGAWLSPKARRHLRRSYARLGITVCEHTAVEAVEPGRAIAADGSILPADVTVWTAGFAVHPMAAASGLEVAADGRILVDRTMRSVSHPDVYVVGDCAHAIGTNGRPLPMSCASAGLTAGQAVSSIVARLTGREVPLAAMKYVGNHISLGQRDAIVQMVDADVRSKSWYLGGRTAVGFKASVLKFSAWAVAHPTNGLPNRRRHLTTAPAQTLGQAQGQAAAQTPAQTAAQPPAQTAVQTPARGPVRSAA